MAGCRWGKWGNRKSCHTPIPAQWQSECDNFIISDTMIVFNPICHTLKWQNVIWRLWDESNILCNKTSFCWEQMNKTSQSLCTWCLLFQEGPHHCHFTELTPNCCSGPSLCDCLLKNLSILYVHWQIIISFIVLYCNLSFNYPSCPIKL